MTSKELYETLRRSLEGVLAEEGMEAERVEINARGLTPEEAELPFILINDGRIVRRNLARSGRNEAWLQKELRRTGHSAGEIFLLTVDGSGKVLCIPKEAKP